MARLCHRRLPINVEASWVTVWRPASGRVAHRQPRRRIERYAWSPLYLRSAWEHEVKRPVALGRPCCQYACVCPSWCAWVLDNPLRGRLHDPERILRGVVRAGDRCLDLGCGPGHFTIPMARLAGGTGHVTAVDLQPAMLGVVRRRAQHLGLLSRINLLVADASGLHVPGTFDVALAFWMVHEVPDQGALLRQVGQALRPGGRLLLVEPKGHVKQEAFERTLALGFAAGLERRGELPVSLSRAVLLERKSGPPGR